MNTTENQSEDKSRYDGLKRADFLKAFFKDHGLTDEEMALYEKWGGFRELTKNLTNDESGMSYAKRRVEQMIAYRDVTLEDLRKDYEIAPWAWPTSMEFVNIDHYTPDDIRKVLKGEAVYLCIFEGVWYFFNVGKEEPQGEELEKLLNFGKWYVYTFSY